MKAQRFFDVNDTYGKPIEVAQSISGKWFFREFGFNGFGKCWSRWEEYEGPSFETHGENRYTGEAFEYDKPVAFWGFNKMHEYDEVPIVRLPA